MTHAQVHEAELCALLMISGRACALSGQAAEHEYNIFCVKLSVTATLSALVCMLTLADSSLQASQARSMRCGWAC